MNRSFIGVLLCTSVFGQAQAVSINEPTTSLTATAAGMSVEDRIARVERLVDNQGMVDMLLRIESLQKEVQQLRGQIELQAHNIEEIKNRQRSLYSDIDRRLLQLERRTLGTASAPVYQEDAAVTTAPSEPVASPDNIKSAAVPEKPPVPTVSAKQADGKALSEQQAYQQAFDLLRDLRYEDAIASFKKFLARYPHGRYAHIAQYWVGEANYAQRNYEAAIKDYQALIKNYAESPKLAEAMLKIGYCYYELKNYPKASASLESLIKLHVGSTEAGQAQNLLQKIKLKQADN